MMHFDSIADENTILYPSIDHQISATTKINLKSF
jgi:hypothetical protein